MSALQWSESMSGRVSFDTADYNQGWWQGTPCAFHLDLQVDDVERFFTDDEHEATCTGWIDCDGLGERMAIAEGTFNLLVAADGPRRREMRYRLFAHDRAGRPVTLAGVKNVEDGWFNDTWVDTTTLFTRLYAGWVARDEEDGADPAGHRGPARLRGRVPGPDAEHARLAARQAALRLVLHPLAAAGLRRAAHGHRLDRLPRPAPGVRALAGLRARAMARVPGARPACAGASSGVRTEDGRELTLHHIRGDAQPTEGPVLLQHGTGVRANLFYGSPMPRSIVDVLLDDGFDVWLGNWRGSIDLPECDYTLDEVARFDHPALIAAVLRETGAPTLKAVVHCQGSTSFALACAGGLVPEVTDVVSNAVSFHVDVPRLSRLQLQMLMPLLSFGYPGLRSAMDAAPDRAARPPAGHVGAHRAPRVPRARVPDGQLHLRRRRQHPLGPREHRPAHAPLDRPRVRLGADHLLPPDVALRRGRARRGGLGVRRAARRRRVVGAARPAALDLPRRRRPTAASCPRSQERSFAWLDRLEPGRHALVHVVPGFTHLDLFFGRDAERDVFSHAALRCNAELPTPGGS